MKKVAVIVDWENIRKTIFEGAARKLCNRVDFNNVDNIINYILSFIKPGEEEVFRIFFYSALNDTDKENIIYQKASKLYEAISLKDYVSLREGKLVKRKKNNVEYYQQKQVDMLIGLDIALSFQKRKDTSKSKKESSQKS
jgi:uncharacterized LabA/DUF88 family protein